MLKYLCPIHLLLHILECNWRLTFSTPFRFENIFFGFDIQCICLINFNCDWTICSVLPHIKLIGNGDETCMLYDKKISTMARPQIIVIYYIHLLDTLHVDIRMKTAGILRKVLSSVT